MKVNKFFRKMCLNSNMNQEDVENLNKRIIIKEVEIVITVLPLHLLTLTHNPHHRSFKVICLLSYMVSISKFYQSFEE